MILIGTARRSQRRPREIGPLGTALRLIVGLGLLYLAGGFWDLSWSDPVVGFVVLPGVMVAVGLLASRYAQGPVRFTGIAGHLANLVVIVALLVNPVTAGGATLFYGASMLIAAACGRGRCEATVISNLILRRDDQIGCPLFFPVDVLEARLRRRSRSEIAVTL
jgi:hypothetical protein